jgi:hypothetical protein
MNVKWAAFQEKLPPASGFQALLAEDFEGRSVVPLGDGLHASVWSAVDGRVAGLADVLPALAGAGDGLALHIPARNNVFCLLGLDGRGRSVLEPIGRSPVPPGCRVAVAHSIPAQQLTYEFSVPLDMLHGKNGNDSWRRPGVTLVVRTDRAAGGGAAAEIARLAPGVYLHPHTRTEYEVLESFARRLPGLDESWQHTYQEWPIRAPHSTKPAEFYRGYISCQWAVPSAAALVAICLHSTAPPPPTAAPLRNRRPWPENARRRKHQSDRSDRQASRGNAPWPGPRS